MKYSQKKTQVLPVRVPEALMGKRAGIFFLLNELELRKNRAKNTVRPVRVSSSSSGSIGADKVQSKPLLLTDEFIFS
ncbi:hypothetical protein [Ruegeria lacuscaerulensis]|uniref:hypothetical protein n=1 Tax=Ruegeria lacuscaerulensis TaxID=55218 RepID=UPI001480DDE8|nr:hypothetical protein [Ruegeria lacuscaerulensis]